MDVAALSRDVHRQADAREWPYLLSLEGQPASRKSTLAEQLAAAVPGAVAVPMDGFHLDDRILTARGDRPRKGAPHTFDVGGFCSLLHRCRSEAHVYAPEFDRSVEAAYAAKIEIGPEDRILVIEGNYLLYDQGGWEHVRPLLDQCWFLDVPEAELHARLTARWTFYDLPDADWTAKMEGNDLPNARLVATTRDRADRVLSP